MLVQLLFHDGDFALEIVAQVGRIREFVDNVETGEKVHAGIFDGPINRVDSKGLVLVTDVGENFERIVDEQMNDA